MEILLSKLLTALPGFLSSVSMVGDDQEEAIRQLRYAERKSPSVYRPARDLFLEVWRGHFTIERALVEAQRRSDPVERKCAQSVLRASASFFAGHLPVGVDPLGKMAIDFPNGLELKVSPVWIQRSSPARLLVLHFWEKPLSAWQLSAAGAILLSALKRDNPKCLLCGLDFVSVAIPEFSVGRRFRHYGWDSLHPLDDEGLERFLARLCAAWDEYQRRGPHEYRPRRRIDLFDQ